jgi:arsenate reductase
LFTTNAGAFFEKLGFETINRSRAPRSIMATRQAVGLCPASATLLTRAVTASILEAEPFHHEREP